MELIILGLVGIGGLGLMTMVLFRGRRIDQGLRAAWGGRILFFGGLEFEYGKRKVRLTRINVGNVSNNAAAGGGHYPLLSVEIGPGDELFIFPLEAKKYLFVGKIPDSQMSLQLGGREIVCVTKRKDLLAKISSALSTDAEIAATLFQKTWAHILVKSETLVGGSQGLRRPRVFKFVGLPAEIYQQPKLLEPYLKSVCSLIEVIESQTSSMGPKSG